MPELPVLLLSACMFLGAALYTSVGHAGASAYIALMALFGIAPAVMRPTALALNILVASFTSYRYLRAGLFRWRTLWPFLLGALPFAFVGGAIQLPGAYYRPIVGVVLLLGGARLLWPKELTTNQEPTNPPITIGAFCGAAVGFLSGLTGTGGGHLPVPHLIVPRLVGNADRFRRSRCVYLVQLHRRIAWQRRDREGAAAGLADLRYCSSDGGDYRHHAWHSLRGAARSQGAWLGANHRRAKAHRRLLSAILLAPQPPPRVFIPSPFCKSGACNHPCTVGLRRCPRQSRRALRGLNAACRRRATGEP